MFPVGHGRGWDGSLWYPETAMGEDIHFSYGWSLRLGRVMECRTITMLRSTGKTLTRRRQDVSTYSDDNLSEAIALIRGKEYNHQDGTFSWFVGAPKQTMSVKKGPYAYNEMETMMKAVIKEHVRRTATNPLK